MDGLDKMTIPYALIRSALRKIWLWSAERKECLKLAKVKKGKYRCNNCKKLFGLKEVQVDHIDPIGKFIDWNTLIERMFCPVSNLQCLCKPCHKAKK